MTDSPTLESTNRLLHDLERKLSFGLDCLDQTPSHTSHASSVVHDPSNSGLARQSIQLSVLLYIKSGNGADFDADLVFADRQQRHVTKFAREYSPSISVNGMRNEESRNGTEDNLTNERGETASEASLDSFDSLDRSLEDHDDYDVYDDFGDEEDDDMLLPPLPPRLPPREMDPDKLYGLYDFLGPDPLHCTLARDEPVYLVNDLDNYWWLIRKLTKKERLELGLRRNEENQLCSDDEDGKVGFVPAECLETYEERLARLNCFKNEELEKTSKDTLPLHDTEEPKESAESVAQSESIDSIQKSATSLASEQNLDTPTIGRKGSILKKSGSLRLSNKSVTFENLGALVLEGEVSDSEAVDFADLYYNFSREDLRSQERIEEEDSEKHSEVLSDLYPAEMPLQINKSSRTPRKTDIQENLNGFHPPQPHDTSSIGSFSPDTPPVGRFAEDSSNQTLRRSLIMDRLSQVTMDIQEHMTSDEEDDNTFDFYSGYGDQEGNEDEEDDAFDLDCTGDENVTPLTSVNSLNNVSLSPKKGSVPAPVLEKRSFRLASETVSPIMGKLDELTEKLAELEQMF